MLQIIDYDRKYFTVTFPFDEHIVNKIRLIHGRKYLKASKLWLIPKNQIVKLSELFPDVKNLHPEIWNKSIALQSARKKILTRLNFKTPYKFKTKPYKFQTLTTRMALSIPSFGIFLDMGLGKTKIAIDIYNNRIMNNKIDKVIIICPLNVLDTWKDEEIPQHSILDIPIYILYGTKKKRLSILSQFSEEKNAIAIINYDGLAVIIKELIAIINERTELILDESHMIKDTKARRTKLAMRLSELTDYVLLLSGTPLLNNLFDVFSQWFMIDGGEHLGESFWLFRKKYFYSDKKGWYWQEKDDTETKIRTLMKTQSIALKKEQVKKDLPPKIYETKYVYLSSKEMKIYKKMKNELIAEYKNKITRANLVLTQLIRLMQISDGFIKTTEGEEIGIGDSKLKVLKQVIESIGNKKVIIWSHFTRSILNILSLYPTRAITFHRNDKLSNIKKFKTSKDINILIANPQKGGLGLNLDCCDFAIYYDNDFSLGHRVQSENRIHRLTSKNPKVIIDIVSKDTIDEKVLETLKEKKNFADRLLKEGIKGILK